MRIIGALLVAFLGACSSASLQKLVSADHASNPTTPEPHPHEAPLAKHSELRVAILGPATARYDVTRFAPSRRPVSIQVTNVSDHQADIAGIDARFSANWSSGVAFPCPTVRLQPPHAHAPSVLAPGQSYAFERDLDCSLPLPGRYAIGVYVTFGEASSAASTGDFAGDFTLDVLQSTHAPRAYPTRPGLYVAMVGDSITRPMSAEAWARGDYHVVIGVINGSTQPISVGAVKLSFLTYKGLSKLPCSGRSESLSFPDTLAPGAVLTQSAPVACAPSGEGIYAIVGKLALASGGPEIEIGRIDLTVSGDAPLSTMMPINR